MWAYTDNEQTWISKKIIKKVVKKFNTTLFTISITPSLILVCFVIVLLLVK
jgi:hypothetical protein